MARHRTSKAQFLANHSNSIHDRRRKVHLDNRENAPRNMRISQSQARGIQGGVSMKDVRELMRCPDHISSKVMAKNGLNVRAVVAASPWDKGRYNK